MQIKCPICDYPYEVPVSFVGEHVECQCGHCWFLRETMPAIQPAYDLMDDDVIEEVCDVNGRFIGYHTTDSCYTKTSVPSQELYSAAKEKFRQSKRIEDTDQAYEVIRQFCTDTSPAPVVFDLFFKLCRMRNIADKRAGKYQAVIDRIEFMLALEQKKHEILYISYGKNIGLTLEDVKQTPNYIYITKTDHKNLKTCREKLQQ
jgi:hypothetical protein